MFKPYEIHVYETFILLVVYTKYTNQNNFLGIKYSKVNGHNCCMVVQITKLVHDECVNKRKPFAFLPRLLGFIWLAFLHKL